MALNLTSIIRRKPAPSEVAVETYVQFEYEYEDVRPSFKRTYQTRTVWAQAINIEPADDGELCFVIMFEGEECWLPLRRAKQIGQALRVNGDIQEAQRVTVMDVMPLQYMTEVL